MNRFFVPYSGKKPAAVEINGHRLIVLSQSDEIDPQDLEMVGADRLKSVKVDEDENETVKFFARLSQRNDAGVIVAPPEVKYSDLLSSLQDQLPWLQ